MNIPTNLAHKPVLEVANYDRIDGPYQQSDTDVRGLSIGIAQWNAPGATDLSAKVWRHTGNMWSRQSEELPLHRVLDLATLVCVAVKDFRDNEFDAEHGDYSVCWSTDNPDFALHAGIMKNELAKNNDVLEKGLRRLAAQLKRLGY